MKRILALLLMLALVLGLCGCIALPSGQKDAEKTGSGDTEAAEENQPQSYRLAFTESVASLNYYGTDSDTVREIMTNCVDSLTEPDRDGTSVAAVSDSWYTNDDQSVWTFSIRSGLVWVDYNGMDSGYTLTAKDFADGVRLMADPACGAESGSFIRSRIQGLQEYYDALAAADAGVEGARSREEIEASFEQTVGVRIIDDYTIEYTLTTSTPYFLTLVQSSTLLLPVELEFYTEMGESFGIDNEHMLYCGPYFVSHFERDKRIVLSRNPLYWDSESVGVATIEYIRPEDGVSQAQLFAEGSLSYAEVDVDDYISLQSTDYADCFLPSGTSLSTDCLFLNFQAENPEFAAFAANESFRKALQYSIDRTSLAYLKDPMHPEDAVRNTITPEGCIEDSLGTDYTDYADLAPIKETDFYDPQQARACMLKAVSSCCNSSGGIVGASACSVDYLPVTTLEVDGVLPVQLVFACSNSNDDIIRAHLIESVVEESIGSDLIDVEIVCIKDWTRAAVVDGNNYDMILSPLVTEGASPTVVLSGLVTGGEYNYGGFSISEYDTQLENAQLSPFFQIRLEMLSKAEAMLIDGAYVIPLTATENAYCLTMAEPFTTPQTIFGSSRYKGMELSDSPVTNGVYAARKKLHDK